MAKCLCKKKKKGHTHPMDEDKLFTQPGFQKALKEEHPSFDIEKIFDKTYKEGKDIKTAPKKKEKAIDKLAHSYNTRSKAGNSSTFYKYERF